jgi:hypothetical protein
MSSIRLFVVVGFLAAVFGSAKRAAADESWQTLMRRAPAETNALMMINVDKVRASKFAQTTGWNSADKAIGGLRSILSRDEIRRCLFAAHLNLADFSPRWEAGVLETKSDSTLAGLAAGIDAPYESLGTTPGLRLPRDAYLLLLEPRLFGVLGPADRQRAARWSRARATPPLESAYLAKIAAFPETVGTEIMLGVDLTDALDLARVKQALGESPTLREAKLDSGMAAEIIVSIEGLALGVRVLDQATGMIRIDFTKDPAPLAEVMKPLLLERLAARGMMIEDFGAWKMDVQGKTAFLGGNLSPVGLSLILSLIEPEIPAGTLTATPNAAASTTIVSAVSATSPTTKQKADVATVSRRNFIQVNDLVTEIRFPNSQMNPTAFGTWMDRQARRIDQLPMLDVDPDLLDFSQGVAKSLRISAANQRNAAIRATTTSRDTTRYYADGYSNQPYKVESASRIQGRMEAASANLSHVDIMRMIDDETAAMRRLLTERYRLEF